MYEDKVKEYDQFFCKEYKYLIGFCKSIDVRNDYESLTHEVYLRCRTRIQLSGFSGSNYLNYTRVTAMNLYKTGYRDLKRSIDYNNPDNEAEIENALQQNFDYDEAKKQYDYEMIYLNTLAYEYVNKYFNEKENAIFRTYYLLKHKKLNYKQLAIATHYSQNTVSNTIKRIKKDLRLNLMCYINTNMRIMELADKVKKVETVLALPFNRNLGVYKQTYIDVFGRPFKSSCSCQIGRLRTDLQTWLTQNKPLLIQLNK